VWLNRLEADHGNLRTALVLSQLAEGDAELGLRIAAALWWFWIVRGYWSEGLAWLTGTVERNKSVDPALRALVLARASRLARQQGKREQAVELSEASLSLAGEEGHKESIALALNTLGWVALTEADYTAAGTRFEKSLRLLRDLDDREQIASTLYNLGHLAKIQGDYVPAEALFEESLIITQELGNTEGITRSLGSLGDIALRQGDYHRARMLYEQSLALAQALGSKNHIAMLLNGLGEVARIEGNYKQAALLYQETREIWQKMGNKWGIAVALHNLGQATLQLGAITHAAEYFLEGLTIERALNRKPGIVECLAGLAAVAAQQQPEQAVRLFSAADVLLAAINTVLSYVDRATYNHHLAAVRAQLAPAAFESAWAEGQAMTMEQAIESAMQVAREAQTVRASKVEPPNGLTPRELEVLRLVAQGLTNPQIADQLIVSRRTINTHLNSIYRKLNVSTRSAATRFAVEHGLA
jgi:DNA-binding NarL/FixJ family response regulator